MKFDLDDDQQLIADTIDDLLVRKFPLSTTRAVVDSKTGDAPVVAELHAALLELGVFGMLVPEQFGGAAQQLLDVAVVAERLGHAAAPGPFLGPVLAGLALARSDSDGLRQRWLPAITGGTARVAVSSFDPRVLWTPEGGFTTTGSVPPSVSVLSFDDHLDLLLVPTPDGVVAVEDVRLARINGLDRTRALSTATLSGSGELLAGGSPLTNDVRNAARVLLAADAYGGASRCVSLAVEYANVRQQFGVPIGSFQAIKHQIADMDLAVEPAQGLYWYAAHAFDNEPHQAAKYAALAKAHLTERYVEVARRLVEVYGGIGFTWECDAHVYLKRAVLDRTLFGSPRELRGEVAERMNW